MLSVFHKEQEYKVEKLKYKKVWRSRCRGSESNPNFQLASVRFSTGSPSCFCACDFFFFPYCLEICRLHRLTPLLHKLAPLLHKLAPLLHRLAPLLPRLTPLLHRLAPLLHRLAPLLHGLTPLLHRLTPLLHRLAPLLRRLAVLHTLRHRLPL